jgi:hypothetical protein
VIQVDRGKRSVIARTSRRGDYYKCKAEFGFWFAITTELELREEGQRNT